MSSGLWAVIWPLARIWSRLAMSAESMGVWPRVDSCLPGSALELGLKRTVAFVRGLAQPCLLISSGLRGHP